MSALLSVQELSKRFGALVVTDTVSLSVRSGEIHALIGPNGAGKSCLIGQITGELKPDAGSVFLHGERVNHLSIEARARRGLARAYQVPRLFGTLSAASNAAVAEIARSKTSFGLWQPIDADPALLEASQVSLSRVGLPTSDARPSLLLAHGQKRLLELAMGFATEPSVLLLDEPLAGLGAGDSEAMVRLLASLKQRYGILLVEHDMQAVFALADRISVLVSGRIIASGTPAEIREDTRVRLAYLGENAGV
jgi:branched-chain amino acid transport system ATP-binding protein